VRSSLTFTFNSHHAQDGTGAQLQRIFGIYALSKLVRANYLHSAIENLMIHSLDPFQTDEELKLYLRRLDSVFNLPSSQNMPNKFAYTYEINRLGLLTLFRYLILSVVRKGNILIKVSKPFPVVDLQTNSYLHVQKYFLDRLTLGGNASNLKRIVIHIRRGSNGADLLPGEMAPRMLPNIYYLTLMNEILEKNCSAGEKMELLIITDTPNEEITFKPIESQFENWITEPRLKNGSVTIKGESFSEFQSDYISKLEISHGGDPILAIGQMKAADFLIMSRSALSYVGAILNAEGVIFYPPSYGSKPMPNWIKVRNWLKLEQP
jgi:hypothetical protein